MRRIRCCLLLLLTAAACGDKPQNPLRDPSYFGVVYSEVLLAGKLGPADSAGVARRRARVDSILASHRLSRAQLEDAVLYFRAQPERWQQVYQTVLGRLDSVAARPLFIPTDPGEEK